MIDISGAQVRWVDVYEDDALWDGEKVPVNADGSKIVLLRIDGNLVAFADVCPHKGTPLSDGDLADGVLTCRVHRWQFDAQSGRSINPVGKPLACFPVRVDRGRILIGLRAAG